MDGELNAKMYDSPSTSPGTPTGSTDTRYTNLAQARGMRHTPKVRKNSSSTPPAAAASDRYSDVHSGA